MSKISNTLPQEGDALSSTDLNSLFTAWNGATNTAMNEDNAANQSVDITNLNLQANSGKAGFILKDMQPIRCNSCFRTGCRNNTKF